MKKLLGLLLLVVLLVGTVVMSASAEGSHLNRAYGFTAYTNGVAFTHAEQYHQKEWYEDFIEVRHEVKNGASTYTNRICAFIFEGGTYYGCKWHTPNMIYYKCTSGNLTKDVWVTPGGRGNTDYKTYLGMDTVRIEGQFRTH